MITGWRHRRRIAGRSLVAATTALFIALAWPAAAAFAHALPVASRPAPGADLSQSPHSVVVAFGEQPDPKLSVLKLLNARGTLVATGPTTVVTGHANELEIAITPTLARGVYTVTWQTVSAVDGHFATGSFAFGVGASAPGASGERASVNASLTPLAVAARWAMDGGLIVLMGLALFRLVAVTETPRRLRILSIIAWVLAALGAVGITLAAAHAAPVPFEHLFSTSLGREFLDRAIPIAATGEAVALFVTAFPTRQWPAAALIVGAAASMAGDVLTSHADASHTYVALEDIIQWGHFASAGCWAGGLVALCCCLPGAPTAARARMARRFSTTALVSVAVLIATGVERGVAEVGSWAALLDTGFGNFALVKIGLLALLLALGAMNRFRNVRRAGVTSSPLLRLASVELVLLGAVLVAAGFLQNLAPSSTQSAAATSTTRTITGTDYGTSVRVSLGISPGSVGSNHFVVDVVDYDSHQPVNAESVRLSFEDPSRPDLGSSDLRLAYTGTGTFSAKGTNLSLTGRWEIDVYVQRGLNSVEVPLYISVAASS